MTHVMNIFANALDASSEPKFYSVEVITYDNESITVEVEAFNAEEAQQLASEQVPNADYSMVQSCLTV